MIKLYGIDISGNTYKVRLLLHLLDITYTFNTLDVKNKEHKSDYFLALNPRGEFPVLTDGSETIWDSQAILIYLAKKYARQHNHWLPNTALEIARVTEWLTVSNDDIFHSLGRARSILKFGYDGDLIALQKKGKNILDWIEQHLSQRNWLATDNPSIADIACYPYIALCEEGRISLQNYAAIQNWMKRIQQLNGYIRMPGID